MRVGIFTDTYYPQINGVATSSVILKKYLEKLGHKVYVFTTTDPNIKEKTSSVFRLPSMPFIFLPSHRMAYMYSPKLLFNLKKLHMDVIHTQSEFPVGILGKVVSELIGAPLVHTYHTMYEDYVHYVANGRLITTSMAQKFSRVFCNRARVIIAPVEKTKNSLLQYGVKRPIRVIPTGLDFSIFKNVSEDEVESARMEAGVHPNTPVVVYVGRVAKEKSLDVVIRATAGLAKKLPDVKLVIVGGGPLLEEYRLLASALDISENVVFLGQRPWNSVGRYYRIGDVFATASTSETQGLTYIEAMAARTPVAAKKDQSVEGILTNRQTGYIFEQDDELAELLFHIITNKEESSEYAKRGYEEIVEKLSAERFAAEVAALYEEVIAEKADKRFTEKSERRFAEKAKSILSLKKYRVSKPLGAKLYKLNFYQKFIKK
ncbi:MAG: glycosyltransferase family 4 protein [Clostridiales bacterium]|jgi:1,2-diacylglycerol 3-alpha-glucosyltransferase|nr:glycosyltransferase family 4 protein [Clostridiales bacterium]